MAKFCQEILLLPIRNMEECAERNTACSSDLLDFITIPTNGQMFIFFCHPEYIIMTISPIFVIFD